MDPFTLFMAAGSIIKGIGGFMGSTANANIMALNQQLFTAQAAQARRDADYSYLRGNFEEAKLRRHVGEVVGAQTAYYGANNLDPTYGSPILLAQRTLTQGETDAELIGVDAKMKAAQSLARGAGFQMQAASAGMQADAYETKAVFDLIGGVVGAGTSMLYGSRAGGAGSNPFFVNQPTDI